MTDTQPRPHRRPATQRGFSLVEVLASLAILAFATSGALVAVGSAADDVQNTIDQRKMRYLIQNLLGDIAKGKTLPRRPGGGGAVRRGNAG